MSKKTPAPDWAWKLKNWIWASPFRLTAEPSEELISREEIHRNMTAAEKAHWPGCIHVNSKFESPKKNHRRIQWKRNKK